jgi:hypothetical protein
MRTRKQARSWGSGLRAGLAIAAAILHASTLLGQANFHDELHQSARSDKFTGGGIERAELEPGQPDIAITVNVPAFQLTLWQNGKEIKTYPIGVGQKEYPIYIGKLETTEIIFNPAWIPPYSEWVYGHKGARPGVMIKPGVPGNPLGKVKIPLGGGFLIHQAEKPSDLGHLVSHGCVRMLRPDLYDLAEKIIAARGLPVTKGQIARAKANSKTMVVRLDSPLSVTVGYDTHVVEGRVLHLYPDVYDHQDNTVESVSAALKTSGVDTSRLESETIREMVGRVNRNEEYAVSIDNISSGRALEGHNEPLIKRAGTKKSGARKKQIARHP